MGGSFRSSSCSKIKTLPIIDYTYSLILFLYVEGAHFTLLLSFHDRKQLLIQKAYILHTVLKTDGCCYYFKETQFRNASNKFLINKANAICIEIKIQEI